MKFQFPILIILSFALLVLNCGGRTGDAIDIQEYSGPILETGHAINYYSDSAVVKMRMESPRQLDFGNGDREFPDGIYLEFYENGKMSSTLRADYCYYTADDDLYKATGNVVIQRVDNKDRLDTEELYWNQKKEDVFTDKYVIIQQGGELMEGVGLEAKQDFSYYKILDPKGTILLNKEGNQNTESTTDREELQGTNLRENQ